MCGLGSIEIGTLGSVNTLPSDHKSVTPESQSRLPTDINKPPLKHLAAALNHRTTRLHESILPIEDALDLLFDSTVRDAVIDAAPAWIRSTNVVGYHGSRLTDEEVASVRSSGLTPHKAETRRDRFVRALSPHPGWHEVAHQLDSILQSYGPGGAGGRREGQVHLTLSRCGLLNGFNQYLTHGSEFDQRVAYELLGPDGEELLTTDGMPTALRVAVPGPLALDAAHPHFGIDDMRVRGEVPNLVKEFLQAWSYKLAYPAFQSRTLEIDCGMVFRLTIPVAWIVDIATFVE